MQDRDRVSHTDGEDARRSTRTEARTWWGAEVLKPTGRELIIRRRNINVQAGEDNERGVHCRPANMSTHGDADVETLTLTATQQEVPVKY